MNTEAKISFAGLGSGEQIGLGILEITSIPDLSILQSKYGNSDHIEERYQNEIASLLVEVYQNYRLAGPGGYSSDISL